MSQLDAPSWRAVDGVVELAVGEVTAAGILRQRRVDEVVVVRGPDREVAKVVTAVGDARVVGLPESVPDSTAAGVIAALRAQQRAIASVRARTDRMELDLRHAQKMDAVGQLASGIAHEINTPIQFIGDSLYFLEGAFDDVLSLVELVRAQPGPPGPVQDLAAEIDLPFLVEEVPRALKRTRGGIARVSTIVRAMRYFARADLDAAPSDLEEALQSTVVVANNRLQYHADVVLDLEPLPLVECRIGDVNQVFLNLLVNAADAIEDAGRGRGTITVSGRHQGDHVEVGVADTGCGIPEELCDRIFEPFFTTKEVGRGTGQGLAISHAIVVERHGGELTVESVPGEGSTFVVRLPVRAVRAP